MQVLALKYAKYSYYYMDAYMHSTILMLQLVKKRIRDVSITLHHNFNLHLQTTSLRCRPVIREWCIMEILKVQVPLKLSISRLHYVNKCT